MPNSWRWQTPLRPGRLPIPICPLPVRICDLSPHFPRRQLTTLERSRHQSQSANLVRLSEDNHSSINQQPWVRKTLFISPSSPSRLSATRVRCTACQTPAGLEATATDPLRCFPEMVENMKLVASEDRDLTVEERNLLSVAYKNVIGARRASWRIVTSIEQKEESKGNSSQVGLIKDYRVKIETELAKICDDILEVLDKHLIPSATSGESKVFYHKMYVNCPSWCFLRYAANKLPLLAVLWP